MNTNHEQFERDFEDFLASDESRLAELYRKLPQAQPDAQLDEAVRATARRAAREAPAMHAHRPRWMPALAAAAVLALTVGVAIRMAPQVWQRPATSNVSEPAAAMQRSEESVRMQPSAASATPPAAPAPAAAPAPPPPAASIDAPQMPIAKPAPQAAPASSIAAPGPAKTALQDAAPQEQAQARQGAAQRAPAQAFPETRQTPAPRAQGFKDLNESRSGQLESVIVSGGGEAVPATAAEPAPAAAPAGAATRSKTAREEPAASAPALPENEKALHLSEPERWLRNIRQLLHEDQREKAVRSLNEFRKRYPDYRLPDDLRELR